MNTRGTSRIHQAFTHKKMNEYHVICQMTLQFLWQKSQICSNWHITNHFLCFSLFSSNLFLFHCHSSVDDVDDDNDGLTQKQSFLLYHQCNLLIKFTSAVFILPLIPHRSSCATINLISFLKYHRSSSSLLRHRLTFFLSRVYLCHIECLKIDKLIPYWHCFSLLLAHFHFESR